MGIVTILEQFRYDHLPENLQAVSKPFSDLAHQTADNVDWNGMLKISLLKLLEAKDAAVRAELL